METLKIYNYFRADPNVAGKLVGAQDTRVWYYRSTLNTFEPASGGATPPSDTAFALIASTSKELAGATFVAKGSKDPPIPPPPPPPDRVPFTATTSSHIRTSRRSSRRSTAKQPPTRHSMRTRWWCRSPAIRPCRCRRCMTPTISRPRSATRPCAGTPRIGCGCSRTAKPRAPVSPLRSSGSSPRRAPDRHGEASRAGLTAAIERLVAAAGTGSTVLFYYSGHGGQVKDQTYVVPYDATASDLAGTSISAEELRKMFATCRARRVLLVFDCCHADGLDAKDVLPFEPGLSARAHETLGEWVIFASSRAGERSYVRRGERNGIFTTHFLGGLREGALDGDDFVGPMGLFRHLAPRVTQAESRQHPVFNSKLERDFPVARYQGGRKATVAKADEQFEYHALLSFAEADTDFVARELLPRLTAAGLKIATASEDLVAPGMDRVLGIERGLELARRTIVVLSRAFLQRETTTDKYTDFELLQRKYMDIESGRYTVLPVYIENPDGLTGVPLWLRTLVGLRLGAGLKPLDSADRQLDKLVDVLQKPVPRSKPA